MVWDLPKYTFAAMYKICMMYIVRESKYLLLLYDFLNQINVHCTYETSNALHLQGFNYDGLALVQISPFSNSNKMTIIQGVPKKLHLRTV